MKITTELIMRGERANLERLLARVEALLRDGWTRNREAEERARRHGDWQPWEYCFSCTAKADRPAAVFWVHSHHANEWYIPRPFSLENRGLREEEDKRLLAELEREFLAPAAAEVGVETEIVEHRRTVENDLTAEAVWLLRAFSESANRDRLLPNDRRRWHAFLIQVHKEEAFFSPASLDEWLQQEGFPADARGQLMNEYETARLLLEAYDEEAKRR